MEPTKKDYKQVRALNMKKAQATRAQRLRDEKLLSQQQTEIYSDSSSDESSSSEEEIIIAKKSKKQPRTKQIIETNNESNMKQEIDELKTMILQLHKKQKKAKSKPKKVIQIVQPQPQHHNLINQLKK